MHRFLFAIALAGGASGAASAASPALMPMPLKMELASGRLLIDANILHEGSGFAMTEARIRVDGKLRSNATITFSHIPFPNPDMRGHMDAVAKRIGFPQQIVTP